MKTIFLSLVFATIFAAFAAAQNRSLPAIAACGPRNVTFTAREAATVITMNPPAPGKALVYFIQDQGQLDEGEHYTLRIGMDGAWVGAYRNNAVFVVSVDPGEHHVCASVQSGFAPGQNLAFAHFTAEPGKVYYFRTWFLGGLDQRMSAHLNLDQPDSDQAKYLISIYPKSISKPRK